MKKNIFFIGGVHGSGKGFASSVICSETNLVHLEASKVLRWESMSIKENKKVNNINSTQDRLTENLQKIVCDSTYYLLDGHFCLMNKDGEIQNVPFETFIKINPISLAIKLEQPLEIKNRLEERDLKYYDISFIESFQEQELNHSLKIANNLCIPHFVLNRDNKIFINYVNNESSS